MELGRRDVELDAVPVLPPPDGRGAGGGLRVYVGLPSWNVALADLYPPRTPPRDRLPLYAGRFSTVELNATFYAVPSRVSVEGWAARAPKGFRFGVKVPSAVSHASTGWRGAASAFAGAFDAFGDAAGPSFFQAPPGVGPEDLPGLLARVDALNGAVHAVEVRHPAWTVGGRLRSDLADALAARGLVPCLSDTPARRDLVHGTVVGDRWILRFLGIPGAASNRARLHAWASWVRDAGLTELWVYLHQPDNQGLMALADDALAAFGDAVVPACGARPGQLGLF